MVFVFIIDLNFEDLVIVKLGKDSYIWYFKCFKGVVWLEVEKLVKFFKFILKLCKKVFGLEVIYCLCYY